MRHPRFLHREPVAASPSRHAGAYPAGPYCGFCTRSTEDERKRRHLVDLLALVENPAALPPALAIRLGAEIIAWLEHEPHRFACDPVGVAPQ